MLSVARPHVAGARRKRSVRRVESSALADRRAAAARGSARGLRHSDELYFAFIREFTGRFRFFFEAVQGVAPDPRAQSQLLRDPKFQDYLALRHLSARDVARRYQGLLKRSEDVLARLEKRIE